MHKYHIVWYSRSISWINYFSFQVFAFVLLTVHCLNGWVDLTNSSFSLFICLGIFSFTISVCFPSLPLPILLLKLHLSLSDYSLNFFFWSLLSLSHTHTISLTPELFLLTPYLFRLCFSHTSIATFISHSEITLFFSPTIFLLLINCSLSFTISLVFLIALQPSHLLIIFSFSHVSSLSLFALYISHLFFLIPKLIQYTLLSHYYYSTTYNFPIHTSTIQRYFSTARFHLNIFFCVCVCEQFSENPKLKISSIMQYYNFYSLFGVKHFFSHATLGSYYRLFKWK